MSFLAKSAALDRDLKFRPLFFPDKFINHGKPDQQNIECGIDHDSIVRVVLGALGIAALPIFTRKSIVTKLTCMTSKDQKFVEEIVKASGSSFYWGMKCLPENKKEQCSQFMHFAELSMI